MPLTFYLVLILAVGALLYFGLRGAVRAYLKFRGMRVIICPDNSQPAAVEVNAQHAAMTAAMDQPDLLLTYCSRWPEKQDCGQDCLKQIEASPAECLVRAMLTRWYVGKDCVYCKKSLTHVDWMEHKPALRSPEGKTLEWSEIKPETVPAVLATHQPVCWNCHIASRFRREHPELVTDRNFKNVA